MVVRGQSQHGLQCAVKVLIQVLPPLPLVHPLRPFLQYQVITPPPSPFSILTQNKDNKHVYHAKSIPLALLIAGLLMIHSIYILFNCIDCILCV